MPVFYAEGLFMAILAAEIGVGRVNPRVFLNRAYAVLVSVIVFSISLPG